MAFLPTVSVLIPCRKEERFIADCVESVLASTYPQEKLEILVVDGMSDDRTREIVRELARRHPIVRLLDNPKQVTPAALNVGIRLSSGQIVVRLDAHARIEPEYISRCVESLERFDADNVGGIMLTAPQREGPLARGIVRSLSHRFGVGNSYFRVHTADPKWVDTVFGGCYRREVFTRVGLFNEHLRRGQDMEFNLRLKRGKGRTLLVPSIVSHYYARSDLWSFWRHNWSNGVWAILPFAYSTGMPVTLRHLTPLLFVSALLTSGLMALLSPGSAWLVALIAGAYAGTSVIAAIDVAIRERDPRYLVLMPVIFASLHVPYGAGSLWALAPAARQAWIRRRQMAAAGPGAAIAGDQS